MPNQPTILVKKSDGTSVRMSWDEFQKYRDVRTYEKNTKLRTTKETGELQTTKSEILTPKAEVRELGSNLPAKIGEEAVATAAPVKDIFVDEAKYMRNAKEAKLRNTT